MQHKYRILASGAAVAACMVLAPLGASAQQSGVQIQVPNTKNAQYYQSRNRTYQSGTGIHIRVPQSAVRSGTGGTPVTLPFKVPVNGAGAGLGAGSGSGGQLSSSRSYDDTTSNGTSGNNGFHGAQMQQQMSGTVSVTPASGGVTNAGTHLGAQANFIDGRQINDLIGDTVYNTQGQNIGTVNDFIVKNGVVRYAIVESGAAFFGLIPGKQVAVPVSELQFNNDNAHLQLAMSRQQFQNLPAYSPNGHGNDTLNGDGATAATGGNADNY
ncbi:MAG TPA: PRC-barrel domain-containing protein [Gammaproteobacteria bacterium]|nr:PRC-barrel domain-containing protein [Gammaproteobacteria bacterium]